MLRPRILLLIGIYLLWMAVVASVTLGDASSFAGWTEGWHRWDADWYLRIWMEGYGSDPRMLVFPPGFPYIIGALSGLFGSTFDLTALVFNLVCFFFASLLAADFLERQFKIPRTFAFTVQLTSPVAFYAFMPYSDALFALLFWWLVPLAVREPGQLSRSEKLRAAALMLAAPWVRLTGYALVVWILFRRWFALAALASLAVFLILNWRLGGSPLAFLQAQTEFKMPRGWFWNGLRYHIYELSTPIRQIERSGLPLYLQTTLLPSLSSLLILFSSAWCARRREFLLALTILAVAVFSRNQFYWRSVLRYDWPLTAFVFLPWLTGAGLSASSLRKAFYLAVVFALGVFGLFFQLSVAHGLHGGGWAY